MPRTRSQALSEAEHCAADPEVPGSTPPAHTARDALEVEGRLALGLKLASRGLRLGSKWSQHFIEPAQAGGADNPPQAGAGPRSYVEI
jgi:hypothetical protein